MTGTGIAIETVIEREIEKTADVMMDVVKRGSKLKMTMVLKGMIMVSFSVICPH